MRLLKAARSLFPKPPFAGCVLPLPLEFSRPADFQVRQPDTGAECGQLQTSAFQSLPPLLVEPQPFLLEIVRSLQAQLDAAGCSATMIFCVISSSSFLPDKDWQRATSTSSLPVVQTYRRFLPTPG